MSHQLSAFTSCSHLLSTPNGPVTYAEKHGTPRNKCRKGASDMRFLTFANTSQAFKFAGHTLRVSQARFFRRLGPTPGPSSRFGIGGLG